MVDYWGSSRDRMDNVDRGYGGRKGGKVDRGEGGALRGGGITP